MVRVACRMVVSNLSDALRRFAKSYGILASEVRFYPAPDAAPTPGLVGIRNAGLVALPYRRFDVVRQCANTYGRALDHVGKAGIHFSR